MTLLPHQACRSSGNWRQGAQEHLACCPSSRGSPSCYGWSSLPVALRQTVATSLSWLHEGYPQRGMGTHKMVVRAPPLEVGQQLWGLLGRGPRTTSQRGYPMADRQIHPFNKSGIQPPRKAHSLQRSFEGGFCPQAHHVRDTHQLAPKVSFFSPDHRSAPVPLATGVLSALGDLPVATVQNER